LRLVLRHAAAKPTEISCDQRTAICGQTQAKHTCGAKTHIFRRYLPKTSLFAPQVFHCSHLRKMLFRLIF
jgi:positive regulator of sigma E activity